MKAGRLAACELSQILSQSPSRSSASILATARCASLIGLWENGNGDGTMSTLVSVLHFRSNQVRSIKKSKQISHFLHTSKILASPRLWCPSSWSLSNTQDVQLGHFQTPITDHPVNAGPNKKGGTSCKDKDDMITVRTTYTNSRKKSKTCSNSKALRALQNVSQEAHKRSSS